MASKDQISVECNEFIENFMKFEEKSFVDPRPFLTDEDYDEYEDEENRFDNLIRTCSFAQEYPEFSLYVPSHADLMCEIKDHLFNDLPDPITIATPDLDNGAVLNELLASHFEPIDANPIEERQAKNAIVAPMFILLNNELSFLSSGVNCLSIGTGSGADVMRLSKAMGRRAVSIDTIDVFDNRIKIGKFRSEFEVQSGTDYVNDYIAQKFNKTYDVILLINSIHYFADSHVMFEAFTKKLKHDLAPGGIVLGIYPSYEGMISCSAGLYASKDIRVKSNRIYCSRLHSTLGLEGKFVSTMFGKTFLDNRLSVKTLCKYISQCEMEPFVWHSRHIFNHFPTPRSLKIYASRSEHRAFHMFRFVNQNKGLVPWYNVSLGYRGMQVEFGELQHIDNLDINIISSSYLFARNKGKHVMRSECQFFSRTGPWYWAPKTDGISTYMVYQDNSWYVLIKGEWLLVMKAKSDCPRLVLQVEICSDKRWFAIQLLAYNNVKPPNWYHGINLLYYLKSQFSIFGGLIFKEWNVIHEHQLEKMFQIQYEGSDGVVIQLETSPPPRFIASTTDECELGNAYYMKNFLNHKVTFDVSLSVYDLGLSAPIIIDIPTLSEGEYIVEVYEKENALHFVKMRPDKRFPNSTFTINRLKNAATIADIVCAFRAKEKENHSIKYTFRPAAFFSWLDIEKLLLAATYPMEFHFPTHFSEVEIENIYSFRLLCLHDLFSGTFDSLVGTDTYNTCLMEVLPKLSFDHVSVKDSIKQTRIPKNKPAQYFDIMDRERKEGKNLDRLGRPLSMESVQLLEVKRDQEMQEHYLKNKNKIRKHQQEGKKLKKKK